MCGGRAWQKTKMSVTLESPAARVNWKLNGFIVVGFLLQVNVRCETHFLLYVYTITSELTVSSVQVYSAVGVYDDRQISHYSHDQLKWITEDLTADGPKVPPDSRDRLLNLFNTLAKSSEPHTLQRRVGCEVEKSSSGQVFSQTAFDDYRFDGVDFIFLDFKTMQWTDKNEKAAGIKMKWNSDKDRRDYFRAYLNYCLTVIRTYNTTKSPPNIHMFAKKAPRDPSKMDLTCLATGFYPKHLQMEITVNDIKLESMSTTGLRPNDDKTFQLRITVRINKEEKHGFECHVTHSSLSQPNRTIWDGTCMNCHEESRMLVAAVVAVTVAVVFVAALLITLKSIYSKNTERKDEEGQCQTNSMMLLNASKSPEKDEQHTPIHLGQVKQMKPTI